MFAAGCRLRNKLVVKCGLWSADTIHSEAFCRSSQNRYLLSTFRGGFIGNYRKLPIRRVWCWTSKIFPLYEWACSGCVGVEIGSDCTVRMPSDWCIWRIPVFCRCSCRQKVPYLVCSVRTCLFGTRGNPFPLLRLLGRELGVRQQWSMAYSMLLANRNSIEWQWITSKKHRPLLE